jgi:FlaA1/EpsC-like NDP-sugar epimerase
VSELVLIAASGLAREVLTMVRASGQYDVVGVLDDDKEMAGITVDGAPVLGTIDDASSGLRDVRGRRVAGRGSPDRPGGLPGAELQRP